MAVLRADWATMSFLHWPVPPDRIQALLPRGLEVDVYDGSAWVGLTPFVMANMRPLGVPDLPAELPIVPGLPGMARLAKLSSTPETNLRTYVRGPDGRDGLWFLALQIGNAALSSLLRAAVGAPYRSAQLTVESGEGSYRYAGQRDGRALYRLEVHPGDPVVASDLEVWLTSRWRAYTVHLDHLLVTPVEHEPWPLQEARLSTYDQSLTRAVGLGDLPDPPVVHFSAGVHRVRIGRPAVVAR